MEIVNNYRDDQALRDSFNALAEKVFCLNFENWYQNGFWKDNYNPFSVVIDGKVAANVSVNQCNVNYNGSVLKLIQLGTVMTDPDHRGKGYAGMLMEKVLKEYEGKADGIYLYANDSVLDFYPKYGFSRREEYRYTKQISNTAANITENVPMNTPEDWEKMVQIMKTRPQVGNMTMTGNEGLFMFYLSQFMQENVFYIEKLDAYVVAETEDDVLMLHAIWGNASVEDVISSFGSEYKKAVLLFTPENTDGYEEELVDEEDTTFFVQGKAFEMLQDKKFMLQPITHA